jgi:hypothetical protein
VLIDEPDLAGRLERTLAQLMARTDELRPSILKEVERQIGLGRAAFAQLADGAEARSQPPTTRTARSAA